VTEVIDLFREDILLTKIQNLFIKRIVMKINTQKILSILVIITTIIAFVEEKNNSKYEILKKRFDELPTFDRPVSELTADEIEAVFKKADKIVDLMRTQLSTFRHDKQHETAHQIAKSWAEQYLNKAYLPPANSRYVYLKGYKNEICDRLQVSYVVNDDIVTITQAAMVFTLQIESMLESAKTEEFSHEKLNAKCKAIFKSDGVDWTSKVRIKEKDLLRGRVETVLGDDHTKAQQQGFGWLHEPGYDFFYRTKETGHVIKSIHPRDNAYWFRSFKKDKIKK